MRRRVIVVGGGAAGLMAAGRAAECGAEVLLLEKMKETGRKILISGKERCNITNAAPLERFLEAYYLRRGRFLRNAFHRFFREELLDLLHGYGVETQVERGGRIFPASGDAAEVRDALLRYALEHGAEVRTRSPVEALLRAEGRVVGVRLPDGMALHADAVILTTGGASFPGTGSTGDGYRMASEVGHTLVPLRPALVPLRVEARARAKAVQGVSLRNVRITYFVRRGERFKPLPPPSPLPPTGEMLFTHFGLSGPLVLSSSLAAVDALRAGAEVWLSIDLKPGMTEEAVRRRLQREFERYPHRKLARLLRGWAPRKLADLLAELSGVAAERPVHTIRAEERERIVRLFKDFRWHITASLPMAAGMVTAGGVSLKEVDPYTFASRRVEGLYLAGEVLDIAADTGGYNLQAAFSSGYLAGEAAARGLRGRGG